VEHIEAAIEETGMGQRVAPAPAICFLDMVGYTRLTVVQDGDYFGRTVNLAARIAGQAGCRSGLGHR
jgi:class 3 adenylate cyclase